MKSDGKASKKRRSAWLIGVTEGMGLEVARQLVAENWRVVLSARPSMRLDSLGHEIGAECVPLDVTDKNEMLRVAKTIFADQSPELIFMNVGDYQPMRLDDFDSGLFEKLNRVNYLANVYLLEATVPLLKKHGGGQILLNVSSAAYRGLPGSAPYSAAKASTLHLAEALHVELLQVGVRLRVINPGFVRSRLTDKNQFAMPFIMEPEDAAIRIVKAIDKQGFEITFPRRLTYILKFMRCLPYAVYFYITRRLVSSR